MQSELRVCRKRKDEKKKTKLRHILQDIEIEYAI